MENASNDEILIAGTTVAHTDYLNIALECAHDGVVIADSSATLIYANRSYELISGFNRSEMIGRNMNELIKLGYISVSGTLNVLKTGEPFSTTQVFKTQRRAIIASTPVFDENGNISMVITNLRDTTDIYQIKGELRRKEIQSQRYYEKLQSLRREISGKVDFVASDTATKSMLRFASQVAEINDPVFLIGEAGTGKKKLAKYIHQRSSRNLMPFIRITMTSGDPDAQFAYLFGTNRGQNAQNPSGILSAADGGTAYFDEITALLPEAQAKINEILSSGYYTLNGFQHRVNIRIVAASCYDLETVKEHISPESELFRSLSLFPIRVPPLRDRSSDIIPLLDFFLKQYNQKTGRAKTFSSQAYQELLHYAWPGNIVELQNFVKRAAVITSGDVIDEASLCEIAEPADARSVEYDRAGLPLAQQLPPLSDKMDLKNEVEQIEAHYMTLAFDRYHNTRDAAESLGMGPSTFIRKRQQYEKQGLMRRSRRSAKEPDGAVNDGKDSYDV